MRLENDEEIFANVCNETDDNHGEYNNRATSTQIVDTRYLSTVYCVLKFFLIVCQLCQQYATTITVSLVRVFNVLN